MDKEMRSERLKAHEKMRAEVRNAVKEAMLNDGMSREEIRKVIQEVLMDEVRRRIQGKDLMKLAREAVHAELSKWAGTKYLGESAKKFIDKEAESLAKKFVAERLSVTVVDKDHW